MQCQPKPKYTWKKDGISITEDRRISVSKEGTLYIADLKGTDFGTYSCEAENTVMSQAGKPNAKQIVKRVLLTLGGKKPSFIFLDFILQCDTRIYDN